MRRCQLCGCASWGPVKDPDVMIKVLATPIVHAVGAAVRHDADTVLLQCDGCASLAREDLIADRVPVGEDLSINSINSLSGYPIVATALRPLPPEETRTERLVRSMLDMTNMDNHTPQALVRFARAIESELDRCCAPHLKESAP